MRRVLAALLILCSCTRSTPDARYRRAETLLKQSKLDEALAEASAGLKAEPSWRFRLLQAEILLAKHNAKDALHILEYVPQPTDAESQARVRMHQGYANTMTARYTAAKTSFDEAAAIAKPLGNPLLEAAIEYRRGGLEIRRGHPDEAEALLRHAIDVASTHGDLYMQAAAMGNLGVLFQNTNRLDDAIYWLEKARIAFQQLGATSSVATSLGNLGWCYFNVGDFDKALAYTSDAESYFRKAGDQYGQQIWLGNLGTIQEAKLDFSNAAKTYKEALQLSQQAGDKYSEARWFSHLASASVLLSDYDAAEKYNQEALRIKQSIGDSSTFDCRLITARIARRRKDLSKAEELFRALGQDPSGDPKAILSAETGLAEVLVEKGDLDHADAQFRTVLARLEHQQGAFTKEETRLAYLSGLIEFYDVYIDFLVTRGQIERALEVAESARAHELDTRLHSAEGQKINFSVTSLRNLARSSRSVFLSYWLGRDNSYLWVVSNQGATIHTLPHESELASLVSSYRSLVETLRDPLESENPSGRKLSAALLKPAGALLSSGQRVILVPDRALYSLNFETLPDPEDPKKYLIDSTTLSIAPSLEGLVAKKTAGNSDKSILVIGDPEPAVEEYPRLPFAAREIALIKSEFPVDHAEVIDGPRAYPGAYRDASPARFGYIHFAAHAKANRESPLDSALILSRRGLAYTLSAREVMNVPLNSSLVTLSACRSAGAKTYSGEGLVGLSWAFLHAGARSVVAGLWDVTDASTAALMGDFYARIEKGEAPQEAIREAKLALVHSNGAYKKPFYWGPFQLYIGTL